MSVHAIGLHKRFGETAALDGADLTVAAGTVCGLLGPNGAGKTTLVRVLTTLTRPDAGRATVAGADVRTAPHQVRERIGLVGQHPAVDDDLDARQNLELFGKLLRLGRAGARRRADDLLARFGLADTGRRPVSGFSGGMRRRLDIAAALLLDPPVLFLDEPTTGLDPRGRTDVWAAVRDLVAGGTTVVLTTQYLDEADQLADRITVVDHGRVIAEGTPTELKTRLGADRLDVVVHDPDALDTAADVLSGLGSATPDRHPDALRISVPVADRVGALTAAVTALADRRVNVADIGLRGPTLDEVFLHLTKPGTAAATSDTRDGAA